MNIFVRLVFLSSPVVRKRTISKKCFSEKWFEKRCLNRHFSTKNNKKPSRYLRRTTFGENVFSNCFVFYQATTICFCKQFYKNTSKHRKLENLDQVLAFMRARAMNQPLKKKRKCTSGSFSLSHRLRSGGSSNFYHVSVMIWSTFQSIYQCIFVVLFQNAYKSLQFKVWILKGILAIFLEIL